MNATRKQIVTQYNRAKAKLWIELDVSPRLTINNFVNLGLRQAEDQLQLPDRHAERCQLTHSQDLGLCEFGRQVRAATRQGLWARSAVMFIARGHQSELLGVYLILASSDVFQIIKAVVGFVAVLVVHLATSRNWSQKSKGDQPVYAESSGGLVCAVENYARVTISGGLLAQYARVRSVLEGVLNASYLSFVGNVIKSFVADDRTPRFGCWVSGVKVWGSHAIFSCLENCVVRLARKAQSFWRAVSILTRNPNIMEVTCS